MSYLNRAMKEEYAAALCAIYMLSEFVEDREYWKDFNSKKIFPRIKRRIEPIKELLSELIHDVEPKQKDSLIRFIEDSKIALVSKASVVATAPKTSFFDQASVDHLAETVRDDRCTFCQNSPEETRECPYKREFESMGYVPKENAVRSNKNCGFSR